ncbi:membrane-bound lytic murein transglycosylase B [Candidatus Magnetomorum sp. HK-1]|nr:membrane-bound lytic murein transglycosylase B [Candidatus Magnetomorum sp. HK-1]
MFLFRKCLLSIPVITFIFFVGFFFPIVLSAEVNESLFSEVKKSLIKDGFDPKMIHDLYDSPEVYFDVKSISGYFKHNEAKLNYNQFQHTKNLDKAKKYLIKHRKALSRVEKEYGVDKEIIVAIMLVETRLGGFTGVSRVINVFSTMAALKTEGPRENLWEQIPIKKRLKRREFVKKANKKAEWAYKELKAFLTYTSRQRFSPLDIRGSYAGAIGLAQFIPSSILSFAKDGNKNGQINLFEHEDAIESIANYLKNFGWRPGINSKKAYKVLFHYNHSSYYVNTLLTLSDLLKQ